MLHRGETSAFVALALFAACGGKVEPEKISTTTTYPSTSSPPPDPPPLPTTSSAPLPPPGGCRSTRDCPSDLPICCLRPDRRGPWPSQCLKTCIMDSETYEACQTDVDCKESPGPCTKHVCDGRPYSFCQAITQRCEQ